jgi:hypothetical protein
MLLALIAGCASVTRGRDNALAIESEPPGASVRSSTGWRCTTPCAVEVKRRSSFVIEVEKAGYLPARVLIEPRIDGAGSAGFAGNILVGGLIGAAIDGATGAMYSHGDKPIVVALTAAVEPVDGTAVAAPEAGAATIPASSELDLSSPSCEAPRGCR